MLAQNFKTAADLGISEAQKDALIKTLVLMETDKLKHVPETEINRTWISSGERKFTGDFNMAVVIAVHECGTAGCIYGTAQLISGISPEQTHAAMGLFYGWGRPMHRSLDSLTVEESATALRSYLTTGDARWDLAVGT